MLLALLLACHRPDPDTGDKGDSDSGVVDTSVDTSVDTGPDTSVDTGPDTSVDSDTDTSGDSDTDTSGESGVDSGIPLGEACDPSTDTCAEGGLCCTPCCATGATPICSAPGRDGACPLPDLSVDQRSAEGELRFDEETFAADSCAVLEGCVGAAGTRRLLRFTTVTPNLGDAAITLGNPTSDPDSFEWSSCHGHYHYSGYMQVDLSDGSGVVAVTQKQAFCLMDSQPWGSPTGGPYYTCGNQGITPGWADVYSADLDCQWVDVTDVPPGAYTLRLLVDPFGQFPEIDETNNATLVSVTIPA